MKRLISSLALLLMMLQGNAQLSSVKSLKDVKKDDNCYDAVKNLVEKYGVLGTEEIRRGNKFLPNDPITHRSFAIVLVKAMDKVQEKFNKLDGKKPQATKDSLLAIFIKKNFKGYSDSAVKNTEGYAQYKDVNNDDPDHESIKRLTNEYRLKLGDNFDTFNPERAMTDKELSKIFAEYFGMRSVVPRAANTPSTRGRWAVYMDALLEHLNEAATDLIASL